MESIAIGAVRIFARESENHASQHGAVVNEYKMARMLEDFQDRARDRLGEKLGGGGWRHDLIGVSGDDRHRDRDFAEALRREDRPRPRRHCEDGANAFVAIGLVGLAVTSPEIRIGVQAR